MKHFLYLLELGFDLDPDRLLGPPRIKVVRDAAKKLNSWDTRKLFDFLAGFVLADEIRFIKIVLKKHEDLVKSNE